MLYDDIVKILPHRYPFLLIDRVVELEAGKRVVALKNVSANEPYFQGHFPGNPIMPGVLLVEAMAQAGGILVLHDRPDREACLAMFMGIDNARFRKPVRPGDQVRFEITLLRMRARTCKLRGEAFVDGELVAEAEFMSALVPQDEAQKKKPGEGRIGSGAVGNSVHPTAIVHPKAKLAEGVEVGPYAVIDEHVEIGARTVIEQGVRVWDHVKIGADCRFFPHSSVGSVPQDLKFGGEISRLEIGDRNTVREFCTLNRGTENGGGVTRIGDDNLLMAYTHIAHDCIVGSKIIFANAATLAGHVFIEDGATIGAFSGVHQFCKVGKHAFIGGYSVITQDALPFVKTVGNRARAYGVNTIGLERKGFTKESVAALKDAYRLLCHANLNTSQALEAVRRDVKGCAEVEYLVSFIEKSERGVIKE